MKIKEQLILNDPELAYGTIVIQRKRKNGFPAANTLTELSSIT